MKFAIRRAVLGVIIIPVVAFAWVVFYALLVGAGAEPTSSVSEVWNDGLWLGGVVTIIFSLEAVIREWRGSM
jgi:hypothetical protein